MRAVHFRVEGTTSTRSQPTACGEIGFNTPDTDAVTCVICRRTPIYELTHARHAEVIEALACPKQEHPCLNNHHPGTPSTSPRS